MSSPHVAVFLGSRWAALEDQATRWREVLVRWRAAHPELRISLIDWPAFAPRAARPGAALVLEGSSWLAGTRLLDARVPMLLRPSPMDARGWRRLGAALVEMLGPVDVAVSANPLWNPVLPHLGASRATFDAVDDWRGHPVAARAGDRIDEGYRRATDFALATCNAHRLSERLRHDFALPTETVLNGVDLAAFRGPAAGPPGLPGGRFAVYVGVVQERVDVGLLCAVAAAGDVPVVVAGPASPEDAGRLERAGATVLGPVPHRLVPGLLQRAAVALVPHHVNEFTTSMDPMKLLEYLAAGLPVITTPLPGVERLSRRVRTADDVPGFVAAVREASLLGRLDGPDPGVLERDWDVVAERLLDLHLGRAR